MCGSASATIGNHAQENQHRNRTGAPPGATGADSKTYEMEANMQPLSTILPKALDQAKASASNTPSSTAPAKSLALKDDQDGVKTLTNLLAQCFDIFPLYGREPEAADNIRKGFRLTLSDYPIDKITEAFRYHLKISRDFPVPADIVTIIERGNKPPFDRAVYIAISRKDREFWSKEEHQYMEDYTRFHRSGKY